VLLNDVPNDCIGNAVIFVPQDIPDRHNLGPRYLRLARLEVGWNAPSRFGNNLNPALDAVT
jgi:hypothetical protein